MLALEILRGIWNGLTERDGEAVRRTAAILRQVSGICFNIFLKIFCSWQFGDVVQGGAWTPHVVISEESNLVHASRFRDQDQGQTVWLLVNRWRGDVDSDC